jgi:HAD superfamily hydrolase (TIGR01509 family)
VRAVLFDLFDTLVVVEESQLPRLRISGQWLGSTLPVILKELHNEAPAVEEGEILSAIATVRSAPPQARPANRELAEHAFFTAMLLCLRVPDPDESLARRLASLQMGAIIAACRPREGGAQLLAELSCRGIRTAVVTNLAHAESATALVSIAGKGHRFDAVVTSIEVGYCKPDSRMFDAALRQLGVSGQDTLHVGDDPLGDVVGARRSGICPIWLNSTDCSWPGPGNEPVTVASLTEVALALPPRDPSPSTGRRQPRKQQ